MECLRQYMKEFESYLSSQATRLLLQMKRIKTLRDEWIREDFERWGETFDYHYSPAYFYVEMKVRMNKFAAESRTKVSVSDTLLSHTEEWLKERYLAWKYDHEEEYPEGCGAGMLWKLFDLPHPKPDTPNIKDVGYKDDDLGLPFIRLAAEVVAIEVPDFELQEAKKQLQKLQAEIERAHKQSADDRTEATHLKTQLRSVKKDLRRRENYFTSQLRKVEDECRRAREELEKSELEAKEACGQLRLDLSRLQRILTTGMEPEFRPTAAEIQAAKNQLSFQLDHFHVALVGRSGSGGTSIFDALTAELLQNVVMFCPPGFGSVSVSQHQYFRRFNLFAFDTLLLVVDGNLLETDLNILRHCQNLGIPFSLIRTKCDLEILRMREDLEKSDPFDIPFVEDKLYSHFRKPNSPFRNEVKMSLSKQLEDAMIKDAKIYLINSRSLQSHVANGRNEDSMLLDEEDFIAHLKQLPLQCTIK